MTHCSAEGRLGLKFSFGSIQHTVRLASTGGRCPFYFLQRPCPCAESMLVECLNTERGSLFLFYPSEQGSISVLTLTLKSYFKEVVTFNKEGCWNSEVNNISWIKKKKKIKRLKQKCNKINQPFQDMDLCCSYSQVALIRIKWTGILSCILWESTNPNYLDWKRLGMCDS